MSAHWDPSLLEYLFSLIIFSNWQCSPLCGIQRKFGKYLIYYLINQMWRPIWWHLNVEFKKCLFFCLFVLFTFLFCLVIEYPIMNKKILFIFCNHHATGCLSILLISSFFPQHQKNVLSIIHPPWNPTFQCTGIQNINIKHSSGPWCWFVNAVMLSS